MTKIDTSTSEVERLAETLLFRGHHHQEKINHLLRRLHVERITAAKTLRALAAERDLLREERERLALAVCGGEDVPGLANSLSVEALEGVAANNRSDSISTINEMLRAEAALTEARARLGALIELVMPIVAMAEDCYTSGVRGEREIQGAAADDMTDQEIIAIHHPPETQAMRMRTHTGPYVSHAQLRALCSMVRALSPDATAAIAEVRRAAKAEGLREAAVICNMNYGKGIGDVHVLVLARAAAIERQEGGTPE